jgi:hypothetical protein
MWVYVLQIYLFFWPNRESKKLLNLKLFSSSK